jgi:hypothetical protein
VRELAGARSWFQVNHDRYLDFILIAVGEGRFKADKMKNNAIFKNSIGGNILYRYTHKNIPDTVHV